MNDQMQHSQWLQQLLAHLSAARQQGAMPGGYGGQGQGLGRWQGGQTPGGGSAQTGQYSGGSGMSGFSPPPGGFDLSRWQGGQSAPGGNAQTGAYVPSQQSRPGQYTGGAGMSGFTPPPGMNLGSFTGGGGQMGSGGNYMQGLASLYGRQGG